MVHEARVDRHGRHRNKRCTRRRATRDRGADAADTSNWVRRAGRGAVRGSHEVQSPADPSGATEERNRTRRRATMRTLTTSDSEGRPDSWHCSLYPVPGRVVHLS